MSSSLSRVFSNSMSTITKQIISPSLKHIFSSSMCTATPPKQNRPLYKDLVNSVFKERNLNTLVQKFKQSSECEGFRSRHLVYQFTVRRLASAKRFSSIEEILEAQKKYPEMASEGFAMRIVNLYGQAGMFNHASKTFDEMPDLKCTRTVKSFNTLLNAAVDSESYDEVEKLFKELPSKLDVTPDEYSYNVLIKAYCEMGSLDSAISMLQEMEEKGPKPSSITFNTLLNALYRDSERFDDAEVVWKRMENSGIAPEIRTFNSKLRGLANTGKVSEAVELVEEIKTKEMKPDAYSYTALIKGYCNDGNLEEAKKVYYGMVEDGIMPVRATIETLVPSLCENRELLLARKLCKESLHHKCFIAENILQLVMDGLAKDSKVNEAKNLAEFAYRRNYSAKRLTLPSDSEKLNLPSASISSLF